MDFKDLALARYSCRKYDPERDLDESLINQILETAVLSPSACNGQPYHITVCRGEVAKAVSKTAMSMNMNSFLKDVPVILVLSEKPYCKTAGIGAKIKHNDYRSIDIGILAAYITAEATAQGLDTCILGWLDDDDIKALCDLDGTVRLVITLGYKKSGYELRAKKRRSMDELVTVK